MLKLVLSAAFALSLAGVPALAQTPNSPGNAQGGAPGAADGPGNTTDSGGAGSTVNTVDHTETGSTNSTATGMQQDKHKPMNGCDLNQAAKSSKPNQNNATGGCMKP